MWKKLVKFAPVKKWTLILIVCCIGTFVSAQQVPQYSQFLQNQYMVNPAATGVYDFMNVTVGGRLQWAGLENAPKTTYLYFAAPADKFRNASMKRTYGVIRRGNKRVRHPRMRYGSLVHAFGGSFVADQYGPFRQLKMMGTYALHLPITRDYNISFGTSLGLSNRAFLPEKAQVLSVLMNTGVFDQTYDTYVSGQGAQNTLELEAGMYFHGKGAFFGVSMNQLTKDFVQFGNRDFNFDPRMHLFVTGGYEIQVNRNLAITPAFLVKYVRPAPVAVEVMAQFEFQERYWFATSYRHKDAVVANLGMFVSNKFKVGYSFDLPITQIRKYSVGSHELVLTLMFGRETSRARF
ncbi:MAG: type IX secretion system membrane protein PorP/SprF [Crocinitomicaceae bacterium]|nr:type IX secretion system membrane protein PorP/SprF [Flavobacteriales bacterium]NQZ38269.1 type IX secretion system membrane protein PorP/SprF [Crocinitomicaceae bacterium]